MPGFSFRDAIDFLLRTGDKSISRKVCSYGLLRLPRGCKEQIHCKAILQMLEDYGSRQAPPRPLSIVVFGPPGSGKSFAIKQLANKSRGYRERLEEINLSQIRDHEQLFARLSRLYGPNTDPKIPLVFLDEFDCALNGQPLGWLKWFLAPMQDGIITYDDLATDIRRTVLIFAGGTASSYDEFKDRHAEYFNNAKGPDFLSRLRGTLEVEGFNTDVPDHTLRRCLVLQQMLGRREPSLRTNRGTLEIENDLLKSLLAVGRYKYGARSLEALLDMCSLTGAAKFNHSCLPPAEFISLHVDRGPMDGLTIGISAGGKADRWFHTRLATTLLERGAVLAYGGDLRTKGILTWMIREEERRFSDLVSSQCKRIQSYLAYPIFCKSGIGKRLSKNRVVEFHRIQTLSSNELELLNLRQKAWFSPRGRQPFKSERRLAWALSLFRMRVSLIQDINALVVVLQRY